jgi:hypothetical protein
MGDFPTHPSAVQPDWLSARLRAAGAAWKAVR